jgi:NAD(P)H-hydrate repair Nnr-like enzyme with NAD(P)H-hydrate epimerase domain
LTLASIDLKKTVYAVDINSGCEADTGSLRSACTAFNDYLCLGLLKPFHLLRKEHQMFEHVHLLDLKLPHPETEPVPDNG